MYFLLGVFFHAASMFLSRDQVVWKMLTSGLASALQLSSVCWMLRLNGASHARMVWGAVGIALILNICLMFIARLWPLSLHPSTEVVAGLLLFGVNGIAIVQISRESQLLQLHCSKRLCCIACALFLVGIGSGLVSVFKRPAWAGLGTAGWQVPFMENVLLMIGVFVAFPAVLSIGDTDFDPTKCRSCGYELTGIERGRCPECGCDSLLLVHPLLKNVASPRLLLVMCVLIFAIIGITVTFLDPRTPFVKSQTTLRLLKHADDFVTFDEARSWRNRVGSSEHTTKDAKYATEWAIRDAELLRDRWQSMTPAERTEVAKVALGVLADPLRRHDDYGLEAWGVLAFRGVVDGVIPPEELRTKYLQSIRLSLEARQQVRTGAIIPFDIRIEPLFARESDRVLARTTLHSSDIEIRILKAKFSEQELDTTAWSGPWQPCDRFAYSSPSEYQDSLAKRCLIDDPMLPRAPLKPGKYSLSLDVELRFDQWLDTGLHQTALAAIRHRDPWKTTITANIEVIEGSSVVVRANQGVLTKKVEEARISPWPKFPFRNGDTRFLDRSESVACQIFAERDDGSKTPLGPWTEYLREGYFISAGNGFVAGSMAGSDAVIALIFVPDETIAERTIHMKKMYTGDPVRVTLPRPQN